MLAATHDGEVLGVVAAIGRVLAAAGVDWHTLAEILTASATPVPTLVWIEPSTVAEACALCRRWLEGEIADKESGFLNELPSFRAPSERQLAWLDRLVDRARSAAIAAGATIKARPAPSSTPPKARRPQHKSRTSPRRPASKGCRDDDTHDDPIPF